MGIEENKATLKRYYDEMMNKGNLALWDELMDDGYYLETPNMKSEAGREAYKQGYEARQVGFSEGQFSIDEMIAEGDAVAIRGYVKGTNTGPIPAMGITVLSTALWNGQKERSAGR